jgi:hypothetical protein
VLVPLASICSSATCSLRHLLCSRADVHVHGVPARLSAVHQRMPCPSCCFLRMTPQLQLLQPCRFPFSFGAALHRWKHNYCVGRDTVSYRQATMAAAAAPAALPAGHHLQERVLLYQYDQLLQVMFIGWAHSCTGCGLTVAPYLSVSCVRSPVQHA